MKKRKPHDMDLEYYEGSKLWAAAKASHEVSAIKGLRNEISKLLGKIDKLKEEKTELINKLPPGMSYALNFTYEPEYVPEPYAYYMAQEENITLEEATKRVLEIYAF